MKNANVTPATTANFSSKEIAKYNKATRRAICHINHIRANAIQKNPNRVLASTFTAKEMEKVNAAKNRAINHLLYLQAKENLRKAIAHLESFAA